MTTIREVRKRGFFGWIFLLIFLGFNALMALWLLTYWSNIGGALSSGSEAGRAGAAIGVTIASGVIFFFWAAGAVITGLLALLTRGPRTYIEETIPALPERRVGYIGAGLLGIIFLLALIVVAGTMGTEQKNATEQRTHLVVRDITHLATEETEQVGSRGSIQAIRATADAKEKFTLKSFQWTKVGSVIMEATFTFDNRSDFDVKDVEVRCDHAAASGTEIDSNTRDDLRDLQGKVAAYDQKLSTWVSCITRLHGPAAISATW
jgi:hypothetical protein